MRTHFGRFTRDSAGVTAVEYGLIAALVSVCLIAGAIAIGASLNTIFTSLTAAIG